MLWAWLFQSNKITFLQYLPSRFDKNFSVPDQCFNGPGYLSTAVFPGLVDIETLGQVPSDSSLLAAGQVVEAGSQ